MKKELLTYLFHYKKRVNSD